TAPRAWPIWASSRPGSRRSRRSICGAIAAADSSRNGRRTPWSPSRPDRSGVQPHPQQAHGPDHDAPGGERREAVAADEIDQEADDEQAADEGHHKADGDDAGDLAGDHLAALPEVEHEGPDHGR